MVASLCYKSKYELSSHSSRLCSLLLAEYKVGVGLSREGPIVRSSLYPFSPAQVHTDAVHTGDA